jgi:hypothetical protein
VTLTGHAGGGERGGGVSAVAVGQLDGRPIIVSGSIDATVRIWDPTIRRTDESRPAPVVNLSGAIYGTALCPPDVLTIATELGATSRRLRTNWCS